MIPIRPPIDPLSPGLDRKSSPSRAISTATDPERNPEIIVPLDPDKHKLQIADQRQVKMPEMASRPVAQTILNTIARGVFETLGGVGRDSPDSLPITDFGR